MEGPSILPIDRASQLMQWDIGYGKFSGGLTYRPKLDISYTIVDSKLEIQSLKEFTVTKRDIIKDKLEVGFNDEADKNYGYFEFELSSLPDMNNTVISNAYIELESDKILATDNLRFHIEMIKLEDKINYDNVKNRKVIERIGYDVSVEDIKNSSKQRFVFDRYAIDEMLKMSQKNKRVGFIISASSHKSICKTQNVEWLDLKKMKKPLLVIDYIKKRKSKPKKVKDLKLKIENNFIKLKWSNPDDESFKGVIVVKNPFRVPCSPYDGQKLYGGKDNYTYDKFGDKHTHKYYAVFSYDDVPNFSDAVYLEFLG